jgi:hypothetical protein
LLEAWVLTALPADVAAARAGVPADVAEAYERVWFDVRAWLDGETSYVPHHVLRVHEDPSTLGHVLRRFAYQGGTLVLEAILDVLLGRRCPGAHATPGAVDELSVRAAVAAYLLPRTRAAAASVLRLQVKEQTLRVRGARTIPAATRERRALTAFFEGARSILRRHGRLDRELMETLFGVDARRTGRA